MEQAESWKRIPGYEGYEASSLGRIRTVDRIVEYVNSGRICRRFFQGQVRKLVPHPGRLPYLLFSLGRKYSANLFVNRAVCAAFHGPPPSPKHQAAHIDGDCQNNREANLEWATPKENSAQRDGHGRTHRGESHCRAKLVGSDIPRIFERYLDGLGREELAEEFGVSDVQILNVLRRRSWAHVHVDPASFQRAEELRAFRRKMGLAAGRGAPVPRPDHLLNPS